MRDPYDHSDPYDHFDYFHDFDPHPAFRLTKRFRRRRRNIRLPPGARELATTSRQPAEQNADAIHQGRVS